MSFVIAVKLIDSLKKFIPKRKKYGTDAKTKKEFKKCLPLCSAKQNQNKHRTCCTTKLPTQQLPMLLEADKSQLDVSPSICVNDCCFELSQDFIDHEHGINSDLQALIGLQGFIICDVFFLLCHEQCAEGI